MALADTYILPPADALADSYILPPADELADSYANLLFGGDAGVRLSGFRTLRGRQGQAVPSGLILPEATGGTPPYTYTCTGRPGGVSFNATTRALSGTPSAAGNFTLTYGVEDSSTPALSASRSISWSVLNLIGTDAIALQDFDEGKLGYGLSDLNPVYAATLISGNNVNFSTVQIWAGPPRTTVGSVVDDPLAQRLTPLGSIISRIEYRRVGASDQFRFFDSDQDLDGNPVDSDIGQWSMDNPDLNLYLQGSTGAPNVELEFDNDRHSGAVWHTTFTLDSTQASWVRGNMDATDQFLFVIA